MNLNLLNRKVHYWASFVIALPLLVIIVTGLMLQIKKQWTWVQPPEHKGSSQQPQVTLEQLLAAAVTVESAGVRGWADISRIDVRPSKGIAKLVTNEHWEIQVDLGNGSVLQTAYRRSDLIESFHDGTFFAGDWTRYGLFLPSAIALLWLWISGMWMWWVPYAAKRRRARKHAS